MKKNLLILLLILQSIALNYVHAQYINIPDANFRTWLNNNGYSSCMNGNMMDTTCALIVNANKVNCSASIYDLTGIQYFDNLDTLICDAIMGGSLPPIHASLLYLQVRFHYLTSISNFPSSLLDIDLSVGFGQLDSIPPLPPGLITLNCFQNKLKAIPTLPSTLTSLQCGHNPIHTLPALPASLTNLECFSDSLTTLPSLPTNLTQLSCYDNLITSLPTLPSVLYELYCGYNQLSTLPALPAFLNHLDIQSNSISNLPNVPLFLSGVSIKNNLFTSVPAFGNGLKSLDCSGNYITSLPVFTGSFFNTLHCDSNQLTSIPPNLPASLTVFSCSHNLLNSLPAFTSNLVFFDCSNNQIATLPALPSTLAKLFCTNNQIALLPAMPSGLTRLICSNNQIATLPVLPSTLSILTCDSTLITNLPVLPSGLDYLSIKYNQINTLPDLPDTLQLLDISYTPLTCLPYIKRINNFLWTGSALNCIPNILQTLQSIPPISSLSLCQPSGNCPTYWNIAGNVYNDLNLDCINNAEDNLSGIPVKLDSAGVFMQEFLTNSSGDYSFRTYYGTYSVRIDTANLPFDVYCPASFNHLSTISAGNSYDSLADFGLSCKPGFDLEAKSISANGTLRPGAQRELFLIAGDAATFYGTNCATGVSGTVRAVLNGPVNYVSPAPGALVPTSVSNDTILWNIADFSLVNPSTNFNVVVTVPISATIGDTVCIELNVNPVAGDNNPSNNQLAACYPVLNSLDPNEKFMSPSGAVDTSTHWFTFTVYFQNTGSAPAEDIYILDSLSNFLDASTFTFLSSSHDVITQLLPGKVLRFNYPNINLADSTANEPASHGYVQFKIKRNSNLPLGTTIANKAFIYFDYNPPIVTNTVSATLVTILSVAENSRDEFQIYPNPARYEFKINSAKIIKEVKIINPVGSLISYKRPNSRDITVRIDEAGLYFLSITIDDKTFTKKIIIN
ncbi:MAG: T9SS type A sorting domain-containing protein [Bacteroidia bacterium]